MSCGTVESHGLTPSISTMAEEEIRNGDLPFIIERTNPDDTVVQFEVLQGFRCRPLNTKVRPIKIPI